MSSPGTKILNGRYEINKIIGRGGMADVYLGKDILLSRLVAIKLLRADLSRDPAFQGRFRREAKSAAALNHRGIVSIYDTGEDKVFESEYSVTSIPYIIMEYVQGETIRQLINNKSLSIENSLDYAVGILEALEYSHHMGIVHRDIKPANVMITPEGESKVMDFGIARAISDSSATLTQTQAVIGTAHYLSPEQARGEAVDFRSDIYSVACLLYEQLTGRPPFVGDSPVAVAYQHVREEAKPPSFFNVGISKNLDAVLLKGLVKDREYRYQCAADFKKDLVDIKFGRVPQRTKVGQKKNVAYTLANDKVLETKSVAQVVEPKLSVVKNKKVSAKRGGSKNKFWLFFLVFLLCGLSLFFVFKYVSQRNADVQIPVLANFSLADAQRVLVDLGLVVVVEDVASDSVVSGNVVRTQPNFSEYVAAGSLVKMFVSSGSAQVVVPDLFNKTQLEIVNILNSFGLSVNNFEFVNSSTVAEGRFVSSVPQVGSVVSSGSVLDVNISKGKVVVPNVIGRNIVEAIAVLQGENFRLNVEVEEVENSVLGEDVVTRQVPASGSEVVQHSVVVLYKTVAPVSKE